MSGGLAVWTFLAAVTLLVPATACADQITLRGTAIPMPPVEVQRIDSGRIAFLDHRGRMSRLFAQEVQRVYFDDLPVVQQAEEALAQGGEGNLERGLMLMLQANDAATEPMHRLWTHLRLSQLHEERSELIEAAGHLAAVVRLDDHAAWTRFEPLGETLPTSIHAVIESRERIQRARSAARDGSVRAMLDRMLEQVNREYESLREHDPETRPVPGGTISGYKIDALRDGALQRPGEAPQQRDGGEADRPGAKDEPRIAAPSRDPATDDGPGAASSNEYIAALIAAERWEEALAICERVAELPGERDLAVFLHHYGIVLRAKDRSREAAMTFMRSAIHFPDSHVAPLSLIEAAEIAGEEFDNARAARLLLERATAKITENHDQSAHDRLRKLKESISTRAQQ